MFLPKNTRNTLNYHLVVAEPPVTVKKIDWAHQTGPRKHSMLLSVTHTLYVYQVCHGVSHCVKDGKLLFVKPGMKVNKHITDDIFSFRKAVHWCIYIVRATQSNCCGALEFLSPEPCSPNSLELNALITRFRESYSSLSISRESNRLKKSRSDWLNSGNALIQHLSEKMRFS